MAAGAAWMIIMRLCIRGLGFVSMIILARLLVPEDFGLVALATVISYTIEVFSEFNFDVWLIRKPDAERKDYDTVWSMSVVRGCVLGALLFLVAPLGGSFFNDSRLEAIIHVLALATAIQGFANVGVIDFQRNLEFNQDFRFMISVRVLTFFITIACAFALRSYWALVIGILSQRIIHVILSYYLHAYRPKWALDAWHEALHFSKWLVVSNILNFVYIRSDTISLGRFANPSELGFYTVAYEIANLATTELVTPIRRAIFPGYSKLAETEEGLQKAFIDVLALTLMLASPLAIGIALCADPIVRLLLGDRWLASIPLIQILSIYGLASIGHSNVVPTLLALRRLKLPIVNITISLAVLLPATVYGALKHGALGAALGITVGNVIYMFVGVAMCMRVLSLKPGEVLGAVWRTVASCAVLVASVVGVQGWLAAMNLAFETFVILAGSIFIGAIAYIGTHVGLWWLSDCPESAEKKIATYIRSNMPIRIRKIAVNSRAVEQRASNKRMRPGGEASTRGVDEP
jgi:O-antigen/teichoic acid export membrane protein